MNKEAISGGVFLLVWILGLAAWGALHPITPDLRSDGGIERDGGGGHPLW